MQSPFWEVVTQKMIIVKHWNWSEYLIEEDDAIHIDFLASRIAEYESNNEKVASSTKPLQQCRLAWHLLRTLIDQHNRPTRLKDEIGSKSTRSVRFCLGNDLTISHIKALSARFGVKPEWFL